jgi:sialate O-acetylesterase
MKLSAMFSDHAVLQQGKALPIWGWTKPRLLVRVQVDGKLVALTQAERDGRFVARMPAMAAGGPHELTVTTNDPREGAIVRDVLVGEVWLCSGQSNMQWTMEMLGDPWQRDIDEANWPRLRSLNIPRWTLPGRQSDVDADWAVCTPQTAREFTAVGFYFARKLQSVLDVPIGLINASWGGTRIEAWISRESAMEDAELRHDTECWDALMRSEEFWRQPILGQGEGTMPDSSVAGYRADPPNTGEAQGWASPVFDDLHWGEMRLPRAWQSAGHPFSGVFWFRKTVEIPPAWAGRELLLSIGAVDKCDVTYFNGEMVGKTGGSFDVTCWDVPRSYRVPGRLVQGGKAVIAVRVYSFVYQGGMIGPVTKIKLQLADEGQSSEAIALAGEWRYAVEHDFGLVQPIALRPGPNTPNAPGALFDNAIAPVSPYALRGALWYQGESNAEPNGSSYGRMLATLIRDWRHVFGQGDFPFLTVQLANFGPPEAFNENSTWARVREGQMQSLALPQTGLAVAVDVGEAEDVHARNKQAVGERLARWALVRTYECEDGVSGGPLFAGATIESGGIRVRFQQVGGGLEARGGALRTFVICGSDRRFVPAAAVIQGKTVWVSSAQVKEPVAVRYAWANNPDGANLYNRAGYPASPFRTDGGRANFS